MHILQNISGNCQQRHLCILFSERTTFAPLLFGVPITSSPSSWQWQMQPELSLSICSYFKPKYNVLSKTGFFFEEWEQSLTTKVSWQDATYDD